MENGPDKTNNGKPKPRRRGACVPVFLLLLAAAGLRVPAYALDLTWRGRELEQKWSKTFMKVGPLRLQPTFVLANAGVDSNLYYSTSEPVKDFTVTAGPKVEGWLPIWRRLILYGSGSPQYVFYAKTREERTWNYYFTGGAALSLRRFFVSLERKYVDAREKWNVEVDLKPRRNEGTWNGIFLLQMSRKTSLEFSMRRTEYDYENRDYETSNVRERLNRTETAYTVSAYYQKNSRTRFFLGAEQAEFDFQFEQASQAKDSRSRSVFAGLEFSPVGRIRGKINLGWKSLDVFNTAAVDYSGLVGDAKLSVRVARPLVLRASYARDFDFSVWYNSAYYVMNRPAAGLSLYLTRSLRLDYDFTRGWNEYPESQDIGGGAIVGRRDDFRIHQAALYVRVWKKMAIGAVVSHWLRDSSLDLEDDKRYFYGLNLTYDF